MITIPCEFCGAEARRYSVVARPRRFCDRKCRTTYSLRKNATTRGETTREKHKSDPVYHAKMVAILKSVHALSQTKGNFDAISERLKKRWRDDDYRKYMSSVSKRMWANEDKAEKIMASWRWNRNKMTSLEKSVNMVLAGWGIDYHFNYQVGRYFIDFAFPSRMIGIECDGAYWHVGKEERDAKRDDWLSSRGWTIIRLSENEIEHDLTTALSIRVIPLIGSAVESEL